MWNILFTLVVAVVIWMLNPLAHFDAKAPNNGVSAQTRNEIKQVQSDAIRQVNIAKELQAQQRIELIGQ